MTPIGSMAVSSIAVTSSTAVTNSISTAVTNSVTAISPVAAIHPVMVASPTGVSVPLATLCSLAGICSLAALSQLAARSHPAVSVSHLVSAMFPAIEAARPLASAHRQGEQGSVTLLALGLAVVLIMICLASIDIAVIVAARAKAQTAADLAALGALTPATTLPRSVAQAVAAGNGASLVECDCGAVEATVTVERAVRLPLFGVVVGRPARARAVVDTRPLFPLPLEPPGSRDGPDASDAGSIPTGGGAATVRALLASPRLELTSQARADLAGGVVDQRLVAILAEALRRHQLAVSVFRTGHSRYVAGTSVVSKHTYGRAMDIYKVDGSLVRPGHAPSRRLVTWLASLGPDHRPSEVGSPFPDFAPLPGHFSDQAHLDHLHIAVG
jgi:secretion/DNA translocation related TadE-like protein